MGTLSRGEELSLIRDGDYRLGASGVQDPNSDGLSIVQSGCISAFISTWDTELAGVSANDSIAIPVEVTSTFPFDVKRDGLVIKTVTGVGDNVVVFADGPGVKTITIEAPINGFRFNNGGDRLKLIDVTDPGCLNVGNNGGYFYGCENLTWTATEPLNLTGTTDLTQCFRACSLFNGEIGNWDTSNVTSIGEMFLSCLIFNKPLNSWNTSSITGGGVDSGIVAAFAFAPLFNQPLSNWDISGATSLFNTFNGATAFDQDLSDWDVSGIANGTLAFNAAGLSTINYDRLLQGWSEQSLQSPLTLGVSGLVYCAAAPARASIVSDFTWSFSGDSLGTNCFTSAWDSTNTSAGSSNSDQISLPLISSGTYDFVIDWGDSTSDRITSWDQAEATHTYSVGGAYTIKISGTFDGFRFNNTLDRLKLTDVSVWGDFRIGNLSGQFYGASNFTCSATDTLDLSGVTSLASTFRDATLFNGVLDSCDTSSVTDMSSTFRDSAAFNQALNSWVTSAVTTMVNMFNGAVAFNQDLNSWVTSAVTNMGSMFLDAIAFNGNITSWNTGLVTGMGSMFYGATAFNQDLNGWNVISVTSMSSMFRDAVAFNQDLNSWVTSAVGTMVNMFNGATTFNGNITSWDTALVTNMGSMFKDAAAFNKAIGGWDTSVVTSIASMFWGATVFNQDLNSWDTDAVSAMSNIFRDAIAFNGDITSWNTSLITNMDALFFGASAFNQDLDGWDVSSVTYMGTTFRDAIAFNQDLNSWVTSACTYMGNMFFGATVFNGNITSWDTGLVTSMTQMFKDAAAFNKAIGGWDVSSNLQLFAAFNGATAFNQDLSSWDVSAVTSMVSMFISSGLSTANYDLLLIAWEQLTLQDDVSFGLGSIQYSAGAAATARASIVSTYSWTITDGGEA
jgi:surface protein